MGLNKIEVKTLQRMLSLNYNNITYCRRKLLHNPEVPACHLYYQ
jgi:hypothetical protein